MSQLVTAYLLGVLTTPLISLAVLLLLDRATRNRNDERLDARQLRALARLRRAVDQGKYDDDLVSEPAKRSRA